MSSRRATEGSWPAWLRVVLSCDRQSFTVKDVLDAAWFRGALDKPLARVLEAHACEQQAATLDQEPDQETLQSMSEEFRYHRDLLTAEETETWLASRDLTEDDFGSFFLRAYWLEKQAPRPAPVILPYPEIPAELLDLLRVDLMLSGDFDSLAEAASWRAVALRQSDSTLDAAPERARFFDRTGLSEAGLTAALGQIERDAGWFEECLRMEAAFGRLSALWLNQAERARALASRRHGLTRLQIESLLAPSRDAAQEAVLCLRENQASMEELAQACGSHREQRDLFLEDFAPDLQQLFVCAQPGEVLNLPEDDSGFLVCRILAKHDPDLADADVSSRIDQKLLEDRFSELTRDRIQWVQPAARPHE